MYGADSALLHLDGSFIMYFKTCHGETALVRHERMVSLALNSAKIFQTPKYGVDMIRSQQAFKVSHARNLEAFLVSAYGVEGR